MNCSLQDYILPFTSMDQMLKALYISGKLSHYTTDNIAFLVDCINDTLLLKLTQKEIEYFLQRVKFYNNLYPTTYVKEHVSLDEKILDFVNKNNRAGAYFETSVNNCINCASSLTKATTKISKEVIVFYNNKVSQRCFHKSLKCKSCGTNHYLSYYIDKQGQRKFYADYSQQQYIAFTSDTIFEISFLENISVEIHFKYTSFKSICSTHNTLYANPNCTRTHLVEHRLRDAWFYHNYLQYLNEYQVKGSIPAMENLDNSLAEIRKSIFPNFVKKWSNHCCNHPDCRKLLNVDGNWKINRKKCAFEG